MPQTNTNQASAWRGGIVVVTLVLGLLLLGLGAAFYWAPGATVQYKTQYVLWKCGLAEEPEMDFDALIELITTTIPPESWEELGGPGAVPPFETNLSHGPDSYEESERTGEIDDIKVNPFAPDPFGAE